MTFSLFKSFYFFQPYTYVPYLLRKTGFYIPEDDILHSQRRENLKFYIALTGWTV
jgi:hypothetical protein